MEPEKKGIKSVLEVQNEEEAKKKYSAKCPNCEMVYGSNKKPLERIIVCGHCGFDTRKVKVKVAKKADK